MDDPDELARRAAILEQEARTLRGAEAALRRRLDEEGDDPDEDGSAPIPRRPLPHAPAGSASREVEREPELVCV